MAIQNRKDVRALSFREKAAFTGVKASKGEMYPSLAFTAGYIGSICTQLGYRNQCVNIGVGVQYNIGSLMENKIENAAGRSTGRTGKGK